jgi:hypothetical protein
MKLFLLALCMFVSAGSFAAFSSSEAVKSENIEAPTTLTAADLSVGQVQQMLGRKLSWKEKIQWRIASKISRHLPADVDEATIKKQKTNATLGLIFSSLGLLVFPLLVIPGIILSNNALAFEKANRGALGNSKGVAQAGKIIGWVTVGLVALAVIIVLAYVAAWASLYH